ncbi:MAG: hypothetical protein QNJ46_32525 [Leptolyngbyaceae cyanobacterium MO_188.B28]|nr:hypothetical protein [Leptolyngbyaceae cyanobacterium MO_188.B28]
MKGVEKLISGIHRKSVENGVGKIIASNLSGRLSLAEMIAARQARLKLWAKIISQLILTGFFSKNHEIPEQYRLYIRKKAH